MQFNTYIFILAFLPILLIGYYAHNKKDIGVGKRFLIIGSLVFYIFGGWASAVLMGISVVANAILAFVIFRMKDKWKIIPFIIGIVFNVAYLYFFKYTNFTLMIANNFLEEELPLLEIVVPIGVSFYTFQQIMYLSNIYKGEIQMGLVDYLLYILYFPKMLMGPLVEPKYLVEQINDASKKKFDINNFTNGVKIFCLGLFKKLVLADNLVKIVTWGSTNVKTATALDTIIVMLVYTFYIYFDFSGYSDMAEGASIMLNISLPQNFNSPYKADTIRDFWKRWHMSLTGFFTKYIYIPLGGSRKGKFRTYLNTMIIFLISGLWHGANWTFILWGVFHGLFSCFDRFADKIQQKIFKPIKVFLTFIVINILWLLFQSNTISDWAYMMKNIFTISDFRISDGLINAANLKEIECIGRLGAWSNMGLVGIISLGLLLVASALICFIPKNNHENLNKKSGFSIILCGIALVWSLLYLGQESVFVYFNF